MVLNYYVNFYFFSIFVFVSSSEVGTTWCRWEGSGGEWKRYSSVIWYGRSKMHIMFNPSLFACYFLVKVVYKLIKRANKLLKTLPNIIEFLKSKWNCLPWPDSVSLRPVKYFLFIFSIFTFILKMSCFLLNNLFSVFKSCFKN